MDRLPGLRVLVAVGLVVGCRPAEESECWFVESAVAAGLDFTHQCAQEHRWHFPELMGGGVGVLDADGDGLLDVYCVQSGDLMAPGEAPGNQLFRNLGGLRFVDRTEQAGVGDHGYGMGCAVADFDSDGRPDLYVTNVGPNTLFRNRGEGRFEDVTAPSGTGHSGWSTSAAWADLDRDGDLDLFVTNYVEWSPDIERVCKGPGDNRDYCHPRSYDTPAQDAVFQNQGDGSFRDVTVEAGLGGATGHGLGVAIGDLTGDGWPDVYVANDGQANLLWVNQRDGTFVDQAAVKGCALSAAGVAEAGMGVQAVDVEQDGDLDLFLTHLRGETNTLYLNEGEWFRDATDQVGLGTPSLPFTGFGVSFVDLDNDADLDVIAANGRVALVPPYPSDDDHYAEVNLLLEAVEGLRFQRVPDRRFTGTEHAATSRGLAVADLDDDGGLDVLIINRDGPLHLLHNRRSGEGNWLGLQLEASTGWVAVGARIVVEAGGREFHRLLQPGHGYCSSNDPRVHVGLGPVDSVENAVIRWPDGTEQATGPLAVNRYHRIRREGGLGPR